MKKTSLYLLLLSLCVTLNAQATNVAVVDIDKVLKNYPVVQRLDKKLRQEFAPRQAKIIAQQQDIETKIKDFKRNAAVMTDTQRNELQSEIDTDKNNLQSVETDFKTDLEQAQKKDMQNVLVNINQAIIKIAKAKHYDIVLQKDRTIYINDSVDISTNVLAVLTGTDKMKSS